MIYLALTALAFPAQAGIFEFLEKFIFFKLHFNFRLKIRKTFQVPSNCHSLCTYEHREHVAAETLIQAIQQDVCDLKYLSNILYCANRNRDNRKCCQFLGMAQPELGVGDR